jgi:hypothetical protein
MVVMSRVVEIVEDVRPLMAAVCDDPDPPQQVKERYAGTDLIPCHELGCTRAVVVTGPASDTAVLLDVVDDAGWSFHDGGYYCPQHYRPE